MVHSRSHSRVVYVPFESLLCRDDEPRVLFLCGVTIYYLARSKTY